jgi:hypothetical protein
VPEVVEPVSEVEVVAAAVVVTPSPSAGLAGLTTAQAALIRGYDEILDTVTGLTKTGIVASRDAGIALLTAKTLSDAIAINADLSRKGCEALIESSIKFSEIGFKAIGDTARSILVSFDAR